MSMKIRASSQILAGTLYDAQVAATAAIATSKLAEGLDFIKKDGSVAFTANIDAGSNTITNVADPVNPQDAATKIYVDGMVQGLDAKESVRVATTGNIDLTTGGLLIIDGVQLVAGNRVIVKDQTDLTENGIYVAAEGEWLRSADAATSATVTANIYAFVEEGTINGDNGFVLVTNGDIVIGTTELVITQFNGAGQIIAGTGMTKTGNQLDVGSGFGITANADNLSINLATDSGLAVDVNGLTIAATTAGDGIAFAAGVLAVDLTATSGLEFVGGQLQIDLITASGLTVDSNGLSIAASFAGDGLTLTTGVLSLATSTAGAALSYTAGVLDVVVQSAGGLQIVTDELGILLNTNSALELAAGGLSVSASIAGDGLSLTAGVLDINLTATGGLQLAADAVGILLDTNSALSLSATGLTVDSAIAGDGLTWTTGVLSIATSAAGNALSLTSGVLDVNVSSTGGIQITSDELLLKIAADSALTVDVNGLTVASTIAGDGLSWTAGVLAVVNKVSATLSNGFIYRGNGSDVATAYRDVVRDAPTTSDQIEYTLAYAPLIGTEQVFVNGIMQESGALSDYTVTGSVITFTSANDPTDKVQVTYLATA